MDNHQDYLIIAYRKFFPSLRDLQPLTDKFGIDGSRLTAIGYGTTKPIADNGTSEGRQKNRRVEVVLEAIRIVQ